MVGEVERTFQLNIGWPVNSIFLKNIFEILLLLKTRMISMSFHLYLTPLKYILPSSFCRCEYKYYADWFNCG